MTRGPNPRAQRARMRLQAEKLDLDERAARLEHDRECQRIELDLARARGSYEAARLAGQQEDEHHERTWGRRIKVLRAAADWLMAQRTLVLVLLVVIGSTAAALYLQFQYYDGKHFRVWLSVLIAGATEICTWTMASMVRDAESSKPAQPAGLYRLGMWGAAGYAATINFMHGYSPADGGTDGGVGLGLGFAGMSLAGIIVCELYLKLKRNAAAGRSREERVRWLLFPLLSLRAVKLRIAAPKMGRDAAWVATWTDRYGAPPPYRKGLLSRMVGKIGKLWRGTSRDAVPIPHVRLPDPVVPVSREVAAWTLLDGGTPFAFPMVNPSQDSVPGHSQGPSRDTGLARPGTPDGTHDGPSRDTQRDAGQPVPGQAPGRPTGRATGPTGRRQPTVPLTSQDTSRKSLPESPWEAEQVIRAWMQETGQRPSVRNIFKKFAVTKEVAGQWSRTLRESASSGSSLVAINGHRR